MLNKDLLIINNEKIYNEENYFYCDNIDIKSIPEELNKNFNITLIARNSKIKRKRKINIEKIKTSSNIFTFFHKINHISYNRSRTTSFIKYK